MKNKIIPLAIFLIVVFLLGLIAPSIISKINLKRTPNSEEDIILNCQGKNLQKTVKCLTKNVRKFYIYTDTPDSKRLDFDDLKELGGDCKNWKDLYCKLSIKLGFKCEDDIVFLIPGKSYAHTIALIYGSTGWCVISAKDYSCFRYSN